MASLSPLRTHAPNEAGTATLCGRPLSKYLPISELKARVTCFTCRKRMG